MVSTNRFVTLGTFVAASYFYRNLIFVSKAEAYPRKSTFIGLACQYSLRLSDWKCHTHPRLLMQKGLV